MFFIRILSQICVTCPGQVMYRSTSLSVWPLELAEWVNMNSMAWSLVQLKAWIPVSTTRRHARKMEKDRWPNLICKIKAYLIRGLYVFQADILKLSFHNFANDWMLIYHAFDIFSYLTFNCDNQFWKWKWNLLILLALVLLVGEGTSSRKTFIKMS